MNNDNIIKFHSKRDREKEKYLQDMLIQAACLQSLEDITQEINLVVGQFGTTNSDLRIFKIAMDYYAEGNIYGEVAIDRLIYMLNCHAANLTTFANRLNELNREVDDSKISEVHFQVSTGAEEYVERHEPILKKHMEPLIKQFENFEH